MPLNSLELFLMGKLQIEEMGIAGPKFHQELVAPTLDDVTILYNVDLISVDNRVESVGNDQACTPTEEL